MTVYSHFSSCICCTDDLLSDDEKCPVFHDGCYLQCTHQQFYQRFLSTHVRFRGIAGIAIAS